MTCLHIEIPDMICYIGFALRNLCDESVCDLFSKEPVLSNIYLALMKHFSVKQFVQSGTVILCKAAISTKSANRALADEMWSCLKTMNRRGLQILCKVWIYRAG